MSKLVPMPSPRGTNREGLYLRSSGSGVAYDAARRGSGVRGGRDAANPWTKEKRRDARNDPGAVDWTKRLSRRAETLKSI